MKRVRPHLTYANVMVTLLAFVVLGGVAYAATVPKNSVGTKQLKKEAVATGKIKAGAVTGAKVEDGSLTGADVVASTLGTVPQAEKASTATSATTAQSAESAKSAQTATSAESAATATTAQSATSAKDSDELGGEPPSAYAPSSRFFYVTVHPDAAPAEKILEVPGFLQIETDGVSDEEVELKIQNETFHEWSIMRSEAESALPPKATLTTPFLSKLAVRRAVVLIIQDREAPQNAVALQCGLSIIPLPPILTCFATLSPALSP